jgi:tetratricopeptide (TPR) repeat protein
LHAVRNSTEEYLMATPALLSVLSLVERLRHALAPPQRAELAEVIGALVSLRAPLGSQWEQLARIAASVGEFSLSARAMDLFVKASGTTPAALYRKATLLAENGALDAAAALLDTLPRDVPDPVANAYTRGTVALNRGQRDEARALLEWVVSKRPDLGQAWLSLAMTADLAREAALGDRLVEAAPRAADAPPLQRAAYFHALGKVHADRDDHGPAFAAYAQGAACMKPLAPYDAEKDRAEAADAVAGYSSGAIAGVASRQGEPTGRTIFVTGLPRSGTTLVEQIVASHSDITGGAETSSLALLAMDVGGRSFDTLAAHVDEAGVEPAARLWGHLAAERFGPDGRVVDKSLDTPRLLGLAAALLPEAPLVWLTRDPLDRAWSCFRTNFSGGAMGWSYDLAQIAAHFRLEDALLAQWRDMLGERLLVVPYEGLVADPAGWTRRLLGHCGMAEEPQVFAPHETQRSVSTASMEQVRQPVSARAVGSATPYREYLAPFEGAYFA